MTDTPSKRGSSIESLPVVPKVAAGGMQPRSIKDKGPVRATVFIPRKTHYRLKQICVEFDTSQQKIFMAALDLWLREQGEPSVQELEGDDDS